MSAETDQASQTPASKEANPPIKKVLPDSSGDLVANLDVEVEPRGDAATAADVTQQDTRPATLSEAIGISDLPLDSSPRPSVDIGGTSSIFDVPTSGDTGVEEVAPANAGPKIRTDIEALYERLSADPDPTQAEPVTPADISLDWHPDQDISQKKAALLPDSTPDADGDTHADPNINPDPSVDIAPDAEIALALEEEPDIVADTRKPSTPPPITNTVDHGADPDPIVHTTPWIADESTTATTRSGQSATFGPDGEDRSSTGDAPSPYKMDVEGPASGRYRDETVTTTTTNAEVITTSKEPPGGKRRDWTMDSTRTEDAETDTGVHLDITAEGNIDATLEGPGISVKHVTGAGGSAKVDYTALTLTEEEATKHAKASQTSRHQALVDYEQGGGKTSTSVVEDGRLEFVTKRTRPDPIEPIFLPLSDRQGKLGTTFRAGARTFNVAATLATYGFNAARGAATKDRSRVDARSGPMRVSGTGPGRLVAVGGRETHTKSGYHEDQNHLNGDSSRTEWDDTSTAIGGEFVLSDPDKGGKSYTAHGPKTRASAKDRRGRAQERRVQDDLGGSYTEARVQGPGADTQTVSTDQGVDVIAAKTGDNITTHIRTRLTPTGVLMALLGRRPEATVTQWDENGRVQKKYRQ